VFDVIGTSPSSIRATFQGMAIRNGFVGDPGSGGAGILVGNADLVVKDCVIAGNRTAGLGGGISNALAPGTSNVALIRTTVINNHAEEFGGGIYVVGDSQGQGSVLTLWGSTVRRNVTGESGGGIDSSTAILRNSMVLGNTAGIDGGGMYGG